MKYSAVVVAALAAVVSAAGLSDLPPCAMPCLTNGLASTACGPGNIACACADPKFIASASTCISSSCNALDQQKALAAASAICKSVGVDIPTGPTGPTASSSSRSAPAATSAPPTTSAPVVPTGYSTSTFGTSSRSDIAPNKTTSRQPYPTIGPNNTNGSTSPLPSISGNINPNGAGRVAAAGSVVGLGLIALFFTL